MPQVSHRHRDGGKRRRFMTVRPTLQRRDATLITPGFIYFRRLMHNIFAQLPRRFTTWNFLCAQNDNAEQKSESFFAKESAIVHFNSPRFLDKHKLYLSHLAFGMWLLAQFLVITHCIIHQHSLCAKVVLLKSVMNIVLKLINYILKNGMNHRTFWNFFNEIDWEYEQSKLK